jgi:ABC-type uncharacterized transport system ATPase subunit
VIVAHDVTRGLDLVATADVHRTLLEFAGIAGAARDQLLVLQAGCFVIGRVKIRPVNPSDRPPEKLGELMAERGSD